MMFQETMSLGVPTAPTASQVSLRADPAYLRLLEAESTWPLKYVFSQPNPVSARAFPIQGLTASFVGGPRVKAYNQLIPKQQRGTERASQARLQTELFGRAPYTATGRGILNHVDINSAVLQGNPVPRNASRTLAERAWNRADFVTVPSELRTLPVETRFGQMTRVAPEYMQPHA
jgi:hypothetical protein